MTRRGYRIDNAEAKPTRCSYETERRIEAQLLPEVVAALSRHGWNVLGVYDLVRRELAAERRAAWQDEQPQDNQV